MNVNVQKYNQCTWSGFTMPKLYLYTYILAFTYIRWISIYYIHTYVCNDVKHNECSYVIAYVIRIKGIQ